MTDIIYQLLYFIGIYFLDRYFDFKNSRTLAQIEGTNGDYQDQNMSFQCPYFLILKVKQDDKLSSTAAEQLTVPTKYICLEDSSKDYFCIC